MEGQGFSELRRAHFSASLASFVRSSASWSCASPPDRLPIFQITPPTAAPPKTNLASWLIRGACAGPAVIFSASEAWANVRWVFGHGLRGRQQANAAAGVVNERKAGAAGSDEA